MTTACAKCGHVECWPEDRFCVKCGDRLESHHGGEPEIATVTMRVADAAYVQVKLGTVYRKKGNHDAALKACRKALDIDPACASALALMADLAADAAAPQSPSAAPPAAA